MSEAAMHGNGFLPTDGRRQDPLSYLRRSIVVEYRKGQTIFHEDQPANSVFLVVEGKVVVSRHTTTGARVVVDLYQADEFFGESAILGLPRRAEEAVAAERTRLMAWSTAEIEEAILKEPHLGVALLQMAVNRTIDLRTRIESFAADSISRRLARALLRFAERMGMREDDGAVRLAPLTHEFLAHYVGTSREIVTQYMNQFRRQERVRYSRTGMVLRPYRLEEFLSETQTDATDLPKAPGRRISRQNQD